MRRRCVRLLAALLLCPVAGTAQQEVLTLERALALAREHGAGVALARGRIEEAQARRQRAARRFQENPVLELGGGPRRAGDEDFLDFALALGQDLEPGRRRAARLAGAEAAVDLARAELAEAERRLLTAVGAAFLRTAAAEERRAHRARSWQTAQGLNTATERRYEEGETTAIELNRSRIALAAARAELAAAEAERESAWAELRALVGIPGMEPAAGSELEIDRRGALTTQHVPDSGELARLLGGLDRRPDLAALAAELRQAEAELRLGRALSRPAFGVRGGFEREEGAEVVTAGLAVSLPVHDRGQDVLAAGGSRADALRQALAAIRRNAEAEVRGAAAVLARRVEAVRVLERTALPAADDNEALAQKSFEAGEIDLGELLLLQREALEVRLVYVDRLREAAQAQLELRAAAGDLP